MIEVVAFRPEHLLALKLQATQATAQLLMTLDHGRQIASAPGIARTVMRGGKPIACGGMIELWKGRAYGWAYLGAEAQQCFKAIHRAALAGLAIGARRWRRMEMAIDPRDPGARRWAVHLGFEFEGKARKWTTDGRTVESWARVA